MSLNHDKQAWGREEIKTNHWAFSLKVLWYLLRDFPLSPDLFPPAAWHLMKQITIMNPL